MARALLVAVLALNREAGDLGRLITEEARSMRRDAHRELIENLSLHGHPHGARHAAHSPWADGVPLKTAPAQQAPVLLLRHFQIR